MAKRYVPEAKRCGKTVVRRNPGLIRTSHRQCRNYATKNGRCSIHQVDP